MDTAGGNRAPRAEPWGGHPPRPGPHCPETASSPIFCGSRAPAPTEQQREWRESRTEGGGGEERHRGNGMARNPCVSAGRLAPGRGAQQDAELRSEAVTTTGPGEQRHLEPPWPSPRKREMASGPGAALGSGQGHKDWAKAPG